MRGPRQRQAGFGLLAFVAIAAIVAITFVVGFSSVMTKEQANQLRAKQEAYLTAVVDGVSGFYRKNVFRIDELSMGNTVTAEILLENSGHSPRYGVKAALSQLLPGDSGRYYRKFIVWLPGDELTANFDEAAFVTTGQLPNCSVPDCTLPIFQVFDSRAIHAEYADETRARLQRIAYKAQAYFKARMLQDPEKNISVNYFRMPFGDCVSGPRELECLNTYQPLASATANGTVEPSKTATILGLTDEELFSPWGTAIEASTLQDAVTDDTPFTMVFRAKDPFGNFIRVIAIQPVQ